MDFLKQPVARDTTPNAPREILARLGTVVLAGAALGAPVLGLLALAGRDEALLRGAYACAILALVLAVTRRLWRLTPSVSTPPPARAASTGASLPTLPASGLPDAALSPPAPAAPLVRPRILLLDASLAGPGGNSSRLLGLIAPRLSPHAELVTTTLSGPQSATFASLEPALRAADAFVFATGTHWDSWSSPLQKFLEDATPAEAGPLWLGKPAAVLVTEHSVGGKAVLSRLQGVLVTLGCTLPPLSGLVLSQAVQLARRHSPEPAASEDFWSPDDLDIIAHNLLAAARQPRPAWRAWPVDRSHFARPWLRADEA